MVVRQPGCVWVPYSLLLLDDGDGGGSGNRFIFLIEALTN